MKKVIAAVDAENFSEQQLIHLNNVAILAGGKLNIIFLENVAAEMYPVAGILPQDAYSYYAEINWKNIEKRRKVIQEKVKLINNICVRKNMYVVLHESEGIPVEEIIKESRFADLLLVQNNTAFATLFASDPPRFVKDVLREAECPVLVLPSAEKEIAELVFTYNGGFSSMYALKTFTELLPVFSAKQVTVLYVDEHNDGKVKNEYLLKEYLQYHYTEWQIKLLTGEPSFEIMNYLMHKTDSVVTLGAYGRSKLSQFFHHSDAEKILHTLNTYFFITHP